MIYSRESAHKRNSKFIRQRRSNEKTCDSPEKILFQTFAETIIEKIAYFSRPHSRPPQMPRFSKENAPLTIDEVTQAFREISNWSHRRSYDPYFCAGEMVAAFCEIMRTIKTRLSVTNPLTASQILRETQKFHYKIILELIDDSDGLHAFTETHLNQIYETLKITKSSPEDKDAIMEKLREFDAHQNDY